MSLHRKCCCCPDSLTLTFADIDANACPCLNADSNLYSMRSALLLIDGSYAIPFSSRVTVGSSRYCRYSVGYATSTGPSVGNMNFYTGPGCSFFLNKKDLLIESIVVDFSESTRLVRSISMMVGSHPYPNVSLAIFRSTSTPTALGNWMYQDAGACANRPEFSPYSQIINGGMAMVTFP